MFTADMDLTRVPLWIAKYARALDLARSSALRAEEGAALEPVPSEVYLGQFAMTLQAVQLKVIAAQMGPEGAELAKAASKAVADILDDWCPTKPRPPFPHRAAVLAVQLAAFAASSANERVRTEIAGVVEQIDRRLAGAR